jgi:hypothetical protein
MRVKNFLDISLLQIWESFPLNFTGLHEDVPYFILLVGEPPEIINFYQNFFQQSFIVVDRKE